MADQETLGQLIRRRMDDLRIHSVAELARRLGYSRSYVTHLANDTSPSKRGKYVPEPDVLRKLANVLSVPESDILRTVDYLSPLSLSKNPLDDIREAGFAFFGGGRELSEEDWEEILAMTRTLIAEKERRKKKIVQVKSKAKKAT
jgi:transcriptional regulator with XRE-family HTH domain